MRRVVKVSRIRIIITIIVVVLTTLLTGCKGKEPNEIAYVVALGIDSTDDDNYKITIQYDGTDYNGWQKQASKANTIQWRFERIISDLLIF